MSSDRFLESYYQLEEQIHTLIKKNDELEIDKSNLQVKVDELQEAARALIASVADALTESHRYKEALDELLQWAKAYPLEVFPEPDLKAIAKLLKEHGHTLDAVSASNMRYVIICVQEIIDKALKE